MRKRDRKKQQADLQKVIATAIKRGASLAEIIIETNKSVTQVIDMMHHPLSARQPRR